MRLGVATPAAVGPVAPGPRAPGREATGWGALSVLALSAVLVVTAPAGGASGQAVPPGGDGTLYVGTYAHDVLVIDEATFGVVGTIPVEVGIPYRMTLSADRRRIYVTEPNMERVEILDLPSRKSIGHFTLSTPERQVRIWGMNVDPLERFAILLVKTYTQRPDRYEIGPARLLRYDLERREVTDTIRWPGGQERENAQILFSPDGASLYLFTADDVLVYDTETLEQVDRWEIARTFHEEGLGRIGGFSSDIYEEPGFYTGLFRVTDPVNRRALMGVARVDLVNRSRDWYPLGPSASVSFSLAPGRTRAYGIHSEVGNYEFWTFDLENRRVESKVRFDGRPRMGLIVGSGGSQLYIGIAGSTIDRYDAGTFQLLETVQLPADMTRWILVPADPATSAGPSASAPLAAPSDSAPSSAPAEPVSSAASADPAPAAAPATRWAPPAPPAAPTPAPPAR